jgi:hypothetical protein
VIQVESYLRSQRLYLRRECLPAPLDETHNSDCVEQSEYSVRSSYGQVKQSTMFGGSSQPVPNVEQLSQRHMAILHLLANSSSQGLLEQDVRASLKITSGSQIDSSRRILCNAGHVNIHKILRGKTYFNVWTLTDTAVSKYSLGQPKIQSVGGSRLHTFMSVAIADSMQSRGWNTHFEAQLNNGKLVDILARRGSEAVCVEIGLPPLNKEVENAANIIQSDLNPVRIIHAVKNSKDKKQLEELLDHEPKIASARSIVEVRLAGDLIGERLHQTDSTRSNP